MTIARTRRVLPAALAGAVLLLAGCSNAASPRTAEPQSTQSPAVATTGAGGVQHVTIGTTDQLRFVPDLIRAHTGRLEITIVNRGHVPHDLTIPALHAASATVSGGQSRTLDLTIAQPGSYRFECTFHAAAGMTGTLVVTS